MCAVKRMKKTAKAKINLTLEILGKNRPDGFHDIVSVMHKIPFGDEVSLDVTENGEILLECNVNLCEMTENLAYKAAKLYLDEYKNATGKQYGARITLIKKTPDKAGLGGGSADAAAVLDMLNEHFNEYFSSEKMHKMAESLGSDVPFCLEEHICALCEGRGEIISDIVPLSDVFCVVAKPRESLSTKGIYSEYDEKFGDNYSKCASFKMVKALEDANLSQICTLLTNDFEGLCIEKCAEIKEICDFLLRGGAMGAQMTGSGSAVFGLFDEFDKAKKCADKLSDNGLFAQSFAF